MRRVGRRRDSQVERPASNAQPPWNERPPWRQPIGTRSCFGDSMSQEGQQFVTASTVPLQQQPRVIVELIGEHVQHRGMCLHGFSQSGHEQVARRSAQVVGNRLKPASAQTSSSSGGTSPASSPAAKRTWAPSASSSAAHCAGTAGDRDPGASGGVDAGLE